MKPKLIIVLALIVTAPLAVVGWLGARAVRDEQVLVEHRLQELMRGQLRAVDAGLGRAVESYEALVLAEMTPASEDIAELRRRTRESAYAVQFYVLDGNGALLFPPVRDPASLTEDERDALQRTRQIWEGGAVGLSAAGETQSTNTFLQKQTAPLEKGWHSWYWGSGLQMLLWVREEERTYVAEINRTRLLAELIASLPETDVLEPELADGRIRLVDSAGAPLYQWGSFEPEADTPPAVEVALGAPLGGWSLEYHAPADSFGRAVAGGFLLNLLAAMALVGGVVVGLGYYFYREHNRELREAEQRVSFVNQVSHELKTPLTNIRLYAELLEKYTDAADGRVRRHLEVIVSESQRLSRLIGNVLTFSRKQRKALELRRRRAVIDDALSSVLDHFRPALAAKGIEVEFRPHAGATVLCDPDAVEQIVGNLVSNVEKYGASGKRLELSSRQNGTTVEIHVADEGPGLSARERERIFEAFYRVSNAQTGGVAGTGIGLTIARDLARLHGGDLELVPSEQGAHFRVTLSCSPAEG